MTDHALLRSSLVEGHNQELDGLASGQQMDFPGTSSPDFGGGVGVRLHYSPGHNFTASQLQLLILGGGGPSTLHSRSQLHCIPTAIPDFGGGGPSTLHSRSQLHCIPTAPPDLGGG